MEKKSDQRVETRGPTTSKWLAHHPENPPRWLGTNTNPTRRNTRTCPNNGLAHRRRIPPDGREITSKNESYLKIIIYTLCCTYSFSDQVVVGERDSDRRVSAFRHVLFVIIWAGHNRSQPSSAGVTLFHLPPIPMHHQDPAECGTSRPPSRACPAILSRTQQHSPQCPLLSHQSSMDYVSASSTSPYAQSTLSSNFTLSPDGSSPSSALVNGKPQSETTGTVFSAQLKRLFCHFIKRYAPGLPGSTSRAHIFPQHDNTTTLHYCPRVHPCALVTICSAAPFLPRIPRVRSLHLTPRDALHQHPTRRFPAHALEALGTASGQRGRGERLDDDGCG